MLIMYELVSLVKSWNLSTALKLWRISNNMAEEDVKTGTKSARKQDPAKRTRQQDPEGTKRNITEVAMREFVDRGLSGARIDEIAAKTNTSKRMIYYYFGDKERLYLHCLEESYREVRQGEAALNLEALGPEKALQTLVKYTFEHRNDHPNFIRMIMIENIHHGVFIDRSEIIQELNASVIDDLDKIYKKGVKEGKFRKGIDTIDLHWHISALCFFNVSNRHTFTKIFEKDLNNNSEQAKLCDQVVAMIMRFVAV